MFKLFLLKDRFVKVTRERGDALVRIEDLEHVNIQLQSECDTIGNKYIQWNPVCSPRFLRPNAIRMLILLLIIRLTVNISKKNNNKSTEYMNLRRKRR